MKSPAAWYDGFPQAEIVGAGGNVAQFLVRHFRDIPGLIVQPPLDAHVVALHLGGVKQVKRTQNTAQTTQEVAPGSMTLMPAYQANRWETQGPIDFAHLTISLGTVEQIVVEEFDREPATHRLHETIGLRDKLLEQLFLAVLEQASRHTPSRLYLDGLLTIFAVSLLERHSTLNAAASAAERPGRRRGGLAGWQLRRVIDHMHAHLHEDVALGALAKLAGLSRAHFFRAFRQSMGESPGQCLAGIRIRHAVTMLETAALPVDEVAHALGFGHTRHFVSAFTRRVGVSPRLYVASRQ